MIGALAANRAAVNAQFQAVWCHPPDMPGCFCPLDERTAAAGGVPV